MKKLGNQDIADFSNNAPLLCETYSSSKQAAERAQTVPKQIDLMLITE